MKFNSIFKSIARYQKVSVLLCVAGLIGSSCGSHTPPTAAKAITPYYSTSATGSAKAISPYYSPTTTESTTSMPIYYLPTITPPTASVVTSRPFSGIPNISGVTCFMNSVLQILAAGYKDDIKGGPLARMITKINNKQVRVERKDIDEFIDGLPDTKTLKEMFESRQQQDPHEFLIQLDNYYKFLEPSICYERIFTMDKQRFLYKDNNKTEETILKLNFNTDNLQKTNTIPEMFNFSHHDPLPEDYKIGSDGFLTFPSTPSSYVRQHGPHCNAIKQTIIDKFSSKLSIYINRSTGNDLLNLKKIEEPIQDTKVVLIQPDPNYDNTIPFHLNGFILHIGNSIQDGHYVAYVKREGIWYIANDDVVSEVSEQQAIDQSQYAYLFFYEKQ